MGWQERAACRGIDPELFFPVSTTFKLVEIQIRKAVRICNDCPVRAECAADRPDNAGGIWGGVYYPDPWQRHRARNAAETAAQPAATDGPAALVAALFPRRPGPAPFTRRLEESATA